jgi:hypothetical protein
VEDTVPEAGTEEAGTALVAVVDTATGAGIAAGDTALEGDIVPGAGTALVAVEGTAPESGVADREQVESDPDRVAGFHYLSFEPQWEIISIKSIA